MSSADQAKELKIFYTYAFLRQNGSPYYIGKGKERRAWVKHRRGAAAPKDDSRILILKRGLTESEAFKHECYMIFVFGRKDLGTGILRNLTAGGQGISGCVYSEETRRKIAVAHLGMRASEETKAKLSEAGRGKRNHRAKAFIFITPGGKEFLVVGEFKAFCHEHGIASSVMKRALRRNCSPPPRNGWKVCYADRAPHHPLPASPNLSS